MIAIAILPFLTPAWVSFEQGRAQAAEWTGLRGRRAVGRDERDPPRPRPRAARLRRRGRAASPSSRSASGRTCATSAACSPGSSCSRPSAAVGLVVLVAGARRMGHPERAWSAIATGMRGLIVAIVVAGVVAAVAFDPLFELFHTLFFPAGSFTFDPRTDRLVQLFPFDFWSETTIVLGAVIVVAAAVVPSGCGRLGPGARPVATRARAGRDDRRRRRAHPMNGVPVARILGFEIRLHLSWLFIVAIVTVTVAGRLTQFQPDIQPALRPG